MAGILTAHHRWNPGYFEKDLNSLLTGPVLVVMGVSTVHVDISSSWKYYQNTNTWIMGETVFLIKSVDPRKQILSSHNIWNCWKGYFNIKKLHANLPFIDAQWTWLIWIWTSVKQQKIQQLQVNSSHLCTLNGGQQVAGPGMWFQSVS